MLDPLENSEEKEGNEEEEENSAEEEVKEEEQEEEEAGGDEGVAPLYGDDIQALLTSINKVEAEMKKDHEPHMLHEKILLCLKLARETCLKYVPIETKKQKMMVDDGSTQQAQAAVVNTHTHAQTHTHTQTLAHTHIHTHIHTHTHTYTHERTHTQMRTQTMHRMNKIKNIS